MVLVLLKNLLVIEMPNQIKLKKLVDFKSNFLHLSQINVGKAEEKIIINQTLDQNEVKMNLDENANLTYITFDCGKAISSCNYFVANLKKDSTLKIYNIVTSQFDATIKGVINLKEKGASVEVMNLLLCTKEATLDSFIDIYHYVGHTSSNLTNYAIAKDDAKMILNNNATIKHLASSSVAHQQTKGLTLSKRAKIKALPNLYIDEYDVVANHACSIGSINKEDLFYLMSRGLSETEASKIVVMGYVKPILDHIDDVDLKQKIEKEFAKKLIN